MKKTLKAIGWIVFSVLLITLVLPFIVAERENETADPQLNITSPQVYSANPFSKLLSRLSDIFSTDRGENLQATNDNNGQTAPNAKKSKNKTRASLARDKKRNKSDKRTGKNKTQKGRTNEAADNENTLDLPETEWVIGEQKMPLIAIKGMHETKLTDPAAKRAKAEKNAAQFLEDNDQIPTAVPAKKSTWDSMVSPIKKFFGLNEKGTNKISRRANIASNSNSRTRGSDSSVNNASISSFDRQSAVNDINNMLNSIATMRADAKYPNPKTAKEREARERMIKEEMRNETIRLNKKYLDYQKQLMEENPQESVNVIGELSKEPMDLSKSSDKDNIPLEKIGVPKYARAVPWETEFEKRTAEGNNDYLKFINSDHFDNKQPQNELDNSILLIYGQAEGNNGFISLHSKENQQNGISAEALLTNKLISFNEDKVQDNTNMVELIYNNRLADMEYFYRHLGCGDTTICYGAAAPYTKENSLAVGPLAFTIRKMAGANFKGMEIDENEAQKYTQNLIELMESPAGRKALYDRGWDRVKELVDQGDDISEQAYQAALQEQKELYDEEMEKYFSDENKPNRIKEYETQAKYNLAKRSITLVTEDQLTNQRNATKAAYRPDFEKLASKENEQNEHRDNPTNLATDYIVLDKPISSFESSAEMAEGLLKAWENATGFVLNDLAQTLLQMRLQQQNRTSQAATQK